MTTTVPDIATPELYGSAIPYDQYAQMRSTPGLAWHPYEDPKAPASVVKPGFWAVTRHEDVKTVSKSPELFSSAIGHTNLWDLQADALEARRGLIDTDHPDHTRLRRIVARSFTPKAIRSWQDLTRQIVAELLDEFETSGGGDWVDKVAAPLPIRVILNILGVPVEDADFLVELSNYLVEGTLESPTLAPDAFGNTTDLRLLPFSSPASHAMFEYGLKLRELRRADPRDDIVTALVQAEQEGEKMNHQEFKNMFQLLVFAGNETTRTAITHAAMAFAEHPEQLPRSLDGTSADGSPLNTMTEEILRWSSPVLHMRRTAVADTELAGTEIKAGDKVVMWYASANRDETVFDDPFTFDVTRDPNPHFAFGGGGPHFCLGAWLARLELDELFGEMARRGMGLEITEDPVRLDSNFVHGIVSVGIEPTFS